jgi:hypothetical protein
MEHRITGKTYGFGRVSPITRPSQFAVSREPGTGDELRQGSRASLSVHDRRRGARTIRMIAFAAVLAVTLAFGVLAFFTLR